MKSYLVDRFPDTWTAHGMLPDLVIDTSVVGTGRNAVAALMDLIEKERARGNTSAGLSEGDEISHYETDR